MWKITKLRLKNFIVIYSGMNRYDITLDFSNVSKKINIFVGKMGSGKSSILGHLQPFSTYGTLDIRNRENQIIPHLDGLKEIHYVHDGHVIQIQHRYLWNDKTEKHNVKSFFQLDGEEKNPNGNVSSFNDLIKTHFGIDQSFLRLLRLGPNVANMINMRSTDRKLFIASLLQDTEVYRMLYQKLTEDLRNLKSVMNMISSKLVSMKADHLEDYQQQADELKTELDELAKKSDAMKAEISTMRGINQALSNNQEPDQLVIAESTLSDEIAKTTLRVEEITHLLDGLPEDGIEKVAIRFGEVSAELLKFEEEVMHLREDLHQIESEKSKLRNQILITQNDEHWKELQARAAEIEKSYRQDESKIAGFTTSYSYNYLTDFVNMVEAFQIDLDEIAGYPKELIDLAYHSDGSLSSWAAKRVAILQAREIATRRMLENIKFSAEYVDPMILYRFPGCPSKDCPYYQTHPHVIRENTEDGRNPKIVSLQEDLDAIKKELAVCEDAVVLAPKMARLKKTWTIISRVLDNIGVLEEHSLYILLTNLIKRNSWYYHESLLSYTEKVAIRENFSKKEAEYFKVQAEMARFKGTDVDALNAQIEELDARYQTKLDRIAEIDTRTSALKKEQSQLTATMSAIQNRTGLISERDSLIRQNEMSEKELAELRDRISQVSINLQRIKAREAEAREVYTTYEIRNDQYQSLLKRIQDIKSATEEFQSYVEDRKVIELILSAVSSKDGIPLIMVKMFLDECREIVNDLISDIFDDNLEIVDFDISPESNEFRIPYKVNGTLVPDIELASQGQQAVISIALSFALCRKSMFDYNIMLLDEIDNSIYRSDRDRFITILIKQMRELGCEQVFLITHNDIFQQRGLPINILLTTDEHVDPLNNQTVTRIYESAS